MQSEVTPSAGGESAERVHLPLRRTQPRFNLFGQRSWSLCPIGFYRKLRTSPQGTPAGEAPAATQSGRPLATLPGQQVRRTPAKERRFSRGEPFWWAVRRRLSPWLALGLPLTGRSGPGSPPGGRCDFPGRFDAELDLVPSTRTSLTTMLPPITMDWPCFRARMSMARGWPRQGEHARAETRRGEIGLWQWPQGSSPRPPEGDGWLRTDCSDR